MPRLMRVCSTLGTCRVGRERQELSPRDNRPWPWDDGPRHIRRIVRPLHGRDERARAFARGALVDEEPVVRNRQSGEWVGRKASCGKLISTPLSSHPSVLTG